ncbi:MAG: TrmB family transcriptional regulator [Pseudomonadales bacterium]|nr:TrmB family transcriptional regulator [Pseudomonadales bacterium]
MKSSGDEAAALIQQLGFSNHEARAYLSLLSCQPASAYEIAKQAGLPTSKIYETVNRLVGKGIFQPSTDPDQKQLYVCLAPDEFISGVQQTTRNTTQQLSEVLSRLDQPLIPRHIWPLTTDQDFRSRAISLVEESQHSVLISGWAQELDWLRDALEAADARGIAIALVHFGEPAFKVGATYHHPVENTLYQEKGGRGFTLVTDSNVVAVATWTEQGLTEGAWSRNQTFVTVSEDYIKHDVYITKVTRFLPKEMQARFGPDFERLRDIFNADA